MCVCTIFRHISNRMHLGKRYEFSRASMILTVSSLSFFSFFFSLHYFSLFVTNFLARLFISSFFYFPNFFNKIFNKIIKFNKKNLIKTLMCHYYSISHYIHHPTTKLFSNKDNLLSIMFYYCRECNQRCSAKLGTST